MSKKPRPQDDFYRYVNGAWLNRVRIPPHESHWGTFNILHQKTQKRLKTIVEGVRGKGLEAKLIHDFYRSAIDMKRRNARGITPLAPYRTMIANIRDRKELVRVIARLERIGMSVPWGLSVDQDLKDSSRYAVYLDQGGLGMPERDYYLKDGSEEKRVRSAYQSHIVRIFKLFGRPEGDAFGAMKTVMHIETALARASMDKLSLRDPHKVYNKRTLSGLAKLAPHIAWNEYFRIVGTPKFPFLIVGQPGFLAETDRLVATLPLSDWQTYLELHLVNGAASALSEPFIRESFAFYGTVLAGNKKMKPRWRRALAAVNGTVGEALGKLYIARHFPPGAKRKMNAMIDDLYAAYEARIKALDWMSLATKKKALEKLHAMGRKIAYPSRWRSYRGLTTDPRDYFGNLLKAEAFEHQRWMRRIGKKVNPHEWFTSPQTVNAYYATTKNEIVFPAGILQAPFFNPNADDAENYGAIGAFIGHEITHGFDDQGSKFDMRGTLKEWWTKADRKRFEKKAAILASQYSQYEVAQGMRVNGKLTLGENIADLGGASIAYDAYASRRAHPDAQRFFRALARAEREHARPEYLKTTVATDPHSPAEFRMNGVAANLPEFYQAFNVKKGDRMYRPPRSRTKVW